MGNADLDSLSELLYALECLISLLANKLRNGVYLIVWPSVFRGAICDNVFPGQSPIANSEKKKKKKKSLSSKGTRMRDKHWTLQFWQVKIFLKKIHEWMFGWTDGWMDESMDQSIIRMEPVNLGNSWSFKDYLFRLRSSSPTQLYGIVMAWLSIMTPGVWERKQS